MNNILCLVGAHVDSLFRLKGPARSGLSVPSVRTIGVGGCAYNVAAAMSALGNRVGHAGIRGRDPDSRRVAEALRSRGVEDAGIEIAAAPTGHYAALVEPDGTLALATAAMDAYAHAERLADHPAFGRAARAAGTVVLDANAPADAIARLAGMAGNARLVLLATSTDKVRNLEPVLDRADLLFANASEWGALADRHRVIRRAVVTDGADGAAIVERGTVVERRPAAPAPVVDVIGAGDAFCAGALHSWIGGASLVDAMVAGTDAAARCVARPGALGWLDTDDMRMDPTR